MIVMWILQTTAAGETATTTRQADSVPAQCLNIHISQIQLNATHRTQNTGHRAKPSPCRTSYAMASIKWCWQQQWEYTHIPTLI